MSAESRAHDLIYDWNLHGRVTHYPKGVELDDETLRDGLQSPSVINPPLEQKVRLLQLMAQLGIDTANIGYAGSSPRSQADIITLARESARLHIKVNVACRTALPDLQAAVESSQKAGVSIEVCAFLGSSPIRRYVEDWDIELLMQRVEESVTFIVKNNLPCMFVTEDTTRADPAALRLMYHKAIECGAQHICVADTVGHVTPDGAYNVVSFVKALVKDSGAPVSVDWHGHQDRGLGVANTLAAIAAGAERVHGTALGIGERCGNTPMDTLLVNLKLMEVIDNDLLCLPDYVRLASQMTEQPIPINWPVVGLDAYRTATGVHAAAVAKAFARDDHWLANRVYSGVPAEWFGLHQLIEIGPMSGVSNVKYYLKSRGIEPDSDMVERILARAKLSDRILAEEDVLHLALG